MRTHEARRPAHRDAVARSRASPRSTSPASAPTAARSSRATCSWRWRAPRMTGCASSAQALAAGAVAVMAERAPPMPLPDGVAFVQVAERAPRAGARGGEILSAPAERDRRRHRHQRQDLGRRLHAPDLGRARPTGGEHRHRRPGLADARGLRLAHHARSGRAASLARRARRRGRDASGDRSLVARARPAPPRRRAHRGRRLHQSQPRSSRLSSDARGLSRRQAAAVHRPDRAGRRGRDRRRS